MQSNSGPLSSTPSNTGQSIGLRRAGYQHPDVQVLVAEVQQEYVRRYGHEDVAPLEPDEFDPPNGMFVIATVDGRPAAMGGWRTVDQPDATAEVRRMYVSPDFRGRGLARAVLRELETTARAAGRLRMILETGLPQPEALALYRSSGYHDVPAFGHYAGSPLSVPLGKRL